MKTVLLRCDFKLLAVLFHCLTPFRSFACNKLHQSFSSEDLLANQMISVIPITAIQFQLMSCFLECIVPGIIKSESHI